MKSPFKSMPLAKQDHALPVVRAVYSAAISLSDKEVQAIVKHTLLRARRDLSS